VLRRRSLIYAVLALAVPLPAFALSGGGSSASADLSVSASLDGCGVLAAQVVCKIDASWNEVDGAKRYTASVTSPDGSVTDYGEVAGTATSFWVPYVGNGTYSVTVSAWGTDSHGERRLLAKERSRTARDKAARSRHFHPSGDADAEPPGGGSTGESTQPVEPPSSTSTTTPPPTTATPPTTTTSTTSTTTTTTDAAAGTAAAATASTTSGGG
jgi:hypothetical protein